LLNLLILIGGWCLRRLRVKVKHIKRKVWVKVMRAVIDERRGYYRRMEKW